MRTYRSILFIQYFHKSFKSYQLTNRSALLLKPTKFLIWLVYKKPSIQPDWSLWPKQKITTLNRQGHTIANLATSCLWLKPIHTYHLPPILVPFSRLQRHTLLPCFMLCFLLTLLNFHTTCTYLTWTQIQKYIIITSIIQFVINFFVGFERDCKISWVPGRGYTKSSNQLVKTWRTGSQHTSTPISQGILSDERWDDKEQRYWYRGANCAYPVWSCRGRQGWQIGEYTLLIKKWLKPHEGAELNNGGHIWTQYA